MQTDLYAEEHEALRDTMRGYIERYVAPHHAEWEKAGIVDRDVWVEAGNLGLLGFELPEEYGGGGALDFRFNAVVVEEIISSQSSGLGFGLHNDVVAPYLARLCTPEQQDRWMPGFCSGALISAIAMTEPAAGSDLQGIKTHASRDGGDWILNGSKTFITNGINSDLVIVVARTDPDAKAAHGTTLLMVERGMPGFERGRNLDKVGLKAQDTAELFFTNVRVPDANVLGELNGGFIHLMENLPQERLSVAVAAVAGAEAALARTIDYCKTRTAFGKPIGSFQNTRFVLAELATEVEIARHYLNKCISEHNAGRYTATDAAMSKWWTTELEKRVVDQCLQLHGGYGYMLEYPIAKSFLDSRVQTIYAGTTEIMKEIVGRSLGV
ncbi:MAG TPA: acyl-CoA dehydrogenase family protein [Mycobacteriales bacterium]|nr:acyl-CoA dehydrogenase family protein [Mycobacteriales bacterium]